MMALPPPNDQVCFSTDEFLDKDFQVDEFVSRCRKRVTMEGLRQDLDGYFRTLKSAMVELINKDYADFVNLSANLVSYKEFHLMHIWSVFQIMHTCRPVSVNVYTYMHSHPPHRLEWTSRLVISCRHCSNCKQRFWYINVENCGLIQTIYNFSL